jgi:hypothetical protein
MTVSPSSLGLPSWMRFADPPLPPPDNAPRSGGATAPTVAGPARAGAPARSDAQVSARLDAFLAASRPIYTLRDGSRVQVSSGFRMSTEIPRDTRAPEKLLPRLLAALPASQRGALAEAARKAVWGRATPEEVRQLTQALISAGKLDEMRARLGRPVDDARAVRWLQTTYGIGIDCAGYVRQAFEAGVARRGHGLPGTQVGGLAGNPRFASIKDPRQLRPGDIIQLAAPASARPEDFRDPSRRAAGERVGHFVIVAGRQPLPEALRGRLGLSAAPGDIDVVRVDSSWGGRRDDATNGAAERTWLLDRRDGTWSQLEDSAAAGLRVVPSAHRSGPVDHPIAGIYRFR